FLQLVRDRYGADLSEVDFLGAPAQAAQAINAWVGKRTEGKIPALFDPGGVHRDTRLVLTNAVYFKGDWTSRFRKDRTEKGEFQAAAGKRVPVPLMQQQGRFRYLDVRGGGQPAAGGFQALELPYVGDNLSMLLLLPAKADGLAEFEKQLTAANLASWVAG